MYRYRRRIAMLSVGAQLGCPVRRRIEGEIEIARPVEIAFETTRSRTPTRFLLQPGALAVRGEPPGQDGVPKTCDEWRNCSGLARQRDLLWRVGARRSDQRSVDKPCRACRAASPQPSISSNQPRQPSGHPRTTHSGLLVQDIFTLSVRRDTAGTLSCRALGRSLIRDYLLARPSRKRQRLPVQLLGSASAPLPYLRGRHR